MRKRNGGAARKPVDLPFAPPDWPATRVEMWKLARIKPYEKNPRTHPPAQIEQLARDMRDDGVTMPILVDENGVIIAGHGRILAAQKNGFEEYPVVIARGWTEERKRAVRLKDNAVALLSGWDAELIRLEVGDLKLSGFDVGLLGFPEAQLRGFGISVGTEGQNDPEEAPERARRPVVCRGDLWVLGDHRLLCGDATSESDVAMCLGDTRPKLCVSDAPYGVEYDANWRNEAAAKGLIGYGAKAVSVVHNDHRIDWSEAWKLFPGDVLYSWHADRHASAAQASLEAAGFEIVCQIIWSKPRFVISRGDYHWQHEPCWYAVRKGRKHNWQGDRSQSTLWAIPHMKSETGHSTQKPIECMKRPIENNSRKGDFVYDPFIGSGTMAIACEMTGRRCLGIEIDPAYVQVVIERWQSFTGRKALLDGKTLEEVAKARGTGRARASGYDGQKDMAESINVCLTAIRERKANGGPGWNPGAAAQSAAAVGRNRRRRPKPPSAEETAP